MADCLTGIRILCGILILLFPGFSCGFYVCYLIGGFTDAIDGTVARKLGKETQFGARLDTIADFVFIVAVLIKIVTSIEIPIWVLICIGVVFIIKITSIAIGYSKYHRFITVHSIMNKMCGVILFIIPLILGMEVSRQVTVAALIVACVVAAVAAVQECNYVMTGKNLS